MSTGVLIEPWAVDTGHRWFTRVRYGLLGCAALLMVAGLALGARNTSVGRLEGAVAAGDVHAVHVIGEGPGNNATVGVQWKPGPIRYQTEVTRPRLHRLAARSDDPAASRDVGAYLRTLQPDLTVTHSPWPTSDSTVWGWSLPGWMGPAVAALLLASIALLVTGPEPWRATRWAWFWLIVTPIGLLPFLLLSGRTPPLPDPAPAGRRLTGGWAFLLMLVLVPMRR
jgi:hypothetical protein